MRQFIIKWNPYLVVLEVGGSNTEMLTSGWGPAVDIMALRHYHMEFQGTTSANVCLPLPKMSLIPSWDNLKTLSALKCLQIVTSKHHPNTSKHIWGLCFQHTNPRRCFYILACVKEKSSLGLQRNGISPFHPGTEALSPTGSCPNSHSFLYVLGILKIMFIHLLVLRSRERESVLIYWFTCRSEKWGIIIRSPQLLHGWKELN